MLFLGPYAELVNYWRGTAETEAARRGSGFKKWKLKGDVRQRPLQLTVWRCSVPGWLSSVRGSERKEGRSADLRPFHPPPEKQQTHRMGAARVRPLEAKSLMIHLLLFKKIIW